MTPLFLSVMTLVAMANGQSTESGMSTTPDFVPPATEEEFYAMMFGFMDNRPEDGVITEVEWDEIVEFDDTDEDGCITLAEYRAGMPGAPDDFTLRLFAHEDFDHNDCIDISDLATEFHEVDTDGNGEVDLQEYIVYEMAMNAALFGTFPSPTEEAPVATSEVVTWGSWGAWTECDYTCGVGVQHRYRDCVRGAEVTSEEMCSDIGGHADQHDVCNLVTCPPTI